MYLNNFFELGQAIGAQFKNFMSIYRQPTDSIIPQIGLQDNEVFVYPDEDLVLEYPDFDELLFPSPTQKEYPAYLII